MAYWLFKSEPFKFSWDKLKSKGEAGEQWDGVRNYQARNMLRDDFARGDRAFLYHSSCEVPGIVALLRVVRAGYPDPTAFERKHRHFDAGSDPAAPRWYAVDVQLERRLARVITLAELKAHAMGKLAQMVLLQRGSRLSVMPVSSAHFAFILSLE